MKITRSYLEKIVLEEVKLGFAQGTPANDELSKKREVYLEEEVPEEEPEGEAPAAEPEEAELSQAVDKMVAYLPDIKNKAQYGQLVTTIVKHAANIQGGKLALVSLYKEFLPKVIKSMK